MRLSGRNPRMRPEANRTVCGSWTQVDSSRFAAQRSFHGGQEGGRGCLIEQARARDNPRVLNQEPDPMFQGPLSETANPENPQELTKSATKHKTPNSSPLLLALTPLLYGRRSTSRMPEGKGSSALKNMDQNDFGRIALAFTYKTRVFCKICRLRPTTS